MPQQTISRRRSVIRGGLSAPPTNSLAARFLAAAINGLPEGKSAQQPFNGQKIATWRPIFGTLLPFTQATLANQPVLALDPNDRNPKVRFAATQTLSTTYIPPLTSASRTMFFIGSGFTTAAQDILHYGAPGTTLRAFSIVVNASAQFAYNVGAATGGTTTTPVTPSTAPVVLMAGYNGTNVAFNAGAQAATPDPLGLNTNGAGDPLTLGGTFSAFDCYEVLVYSAALSDDLIDAVSAYSRTRYVTPVLV